MEPSGLAASAVSAWAAAACICGLLHQLTCDGIEVKATRTCHDTSFECAWLRSKKYTGLKKKGIHPSLVELTAAALAGEQITDEVRPSVKAPPGPDQAAAPPVAGDTASAPDTREAALA